MLQDAKHSNPSESGQVTGALIEDSFSTYNDGKSFSAKFEVSDQVDGEAEPSVGFEGSFNTVQHSPSKDDPSSIIEVDDEEMRSGRSSGSEKENSDVG
jgi:hypothetical protein